MLSVQEITIAAEIGIIYGVLALGIYLTFRVINFPDLTCDGSFVTGAAISSVLLKNGVNPFVALFFAAIAGGVAGFFTGVLNVRFKINDLLSGVIVAFMLYSVNLRIMGTNPNISLAEVATVFDVGSPIIVSSIVVILLVSFLAFFLNSDFGLSVFAVGENRQFSLANGIAVNIILIFGLVVSNALIGLCGALFTQYQGFCDVSQGVGCLVIGLASVIVGEKITPFMERSAYFSKKIAYQKFIKTFSILTSCVVGSTAYRIFLAIAINSDFIFGLKTQDVNFITGLIMIFFMTTAGKRKENGKC